MSVIADTGCIKNTPTLRSWEHAGEMEQVPLSQMYIGFLRIDVKLSSSLPVGKEFLEFLRNRAKGALNVVRMLVREVDVRSIDHRVQLVETDLQVNRVMA